MSYEKLSYQEIIDELKECESASCIGKCQESRILLELKGYRDMETNNTIIRLPCKIGTEVFRLYGTCVKKLMHRDNCSKCIDADINIERIMFSVDHISEFGKTVFATVRDAIEAKTQLEKKLL